MTHNTRRVSNRLIGNLLSAWKGISSPFTGKRLELSAYLHENELQPLREKISGCLESKGGQVSARAHAAELGNAYLGLNDEGRLKYLRLLVEEFGIDHDQVRESAEALFSDLDPQTRCKVEQSLRKRLTPPYLTLLTQFNALPQGVKFLVDMRTDLLKLKRNHPELVSIDEELRLQLSSWFDIGFLELKRIDWNAPASLLEKLIEFEAVHRVESWDDLHHRLGENRRCFGFFHPRMPDVPLIFIWVALETGLSDNVDKLLDHSQNGILEEEVTTAIFYSITSTQRGLNGVSLGDFLIKRVTEQLRQELPGLSVFSTLSPIPGLAKWLDTQLSIPGAFSITQEELASLSSCTDQPIDKLLKNSEWLLDEALALQIKPILQRAAATYLTRVNETGSRALDAVAHFHLSNGAIVERINWSADTSVRGKEQSYTLMVNYLYNLENIESNHEQYIENGVIARSKTVDALLV